MRATILAAALLLAAPAQAQTAYPQWLPASLDGTIQIDYNSLRVSDQGVRSVDATLLGGAAGSMFIACDRWRFAVQVTGAPFPTAWEIIRPGQAPETIAYALCPGPARQGQLHVMQQQKRGAVAPSPVPVRFDASLDTLAREGVISPAEALRVLQGLP